MTRNIGTALIALALLIGGYTIWKAYTPATDLAVEPDKSVVAAASASVKAGTVKGTPAPSTNSKSPTPTRIEIPKLGVNAKVLPVGLTKSGLMDAPKNFSDTGWYKYGTVPGDIGSAVIDGHEDNAIDLDGVFKHLVDLKPGDDVYITRADGKRLHFKVERSAIYPYNDKAHLNEIFNKADAARLNLISCTGNWVQALKTNDKRIVVYTKLVD